MRKQDYYNPSNKKEELWLAVIGMISMIAFVFGAWICSFIV